MPEVNKGVSDSGRVSPQRSYLMSRVKSRDTKPELKVRRLLHKSGFRFRLQAKELPGRPDIVFRTRRKAVFVHGCFWHRHGCKKTTTPKSNVEFWEAKFRRNVNRDQSALEQLDALGWEVLVLWECELANLRELEARLAAFINGQKCATRESETSITLSSKSVWLAT
jgi:DNA mismatch endonuclease (patch repair protein)